MVYNIYGKDGLVRIRHIFLGIKIPEKGGSAMSKKLKVVLTWLFGIGSVLTLTVPGIISAVEEVEATKDKVTRIKNDEK